MDGHSVFWKTWYDKGVIFTQDLLNTNLEWMSFEEFKMKYKIKTNFLKYFGLLSAVKQAMKHLDINLQTLPVLDLKMRS